MSELIETFVKIALPIILALVAVFTACKDLFLTKKRIFEEREKLSKLSYDLYKITEDEDLKRLAVEYGYAAITKESFLNLTQRKALVKSENPTRDIDLFVKCRGLLNINTEPLSFFWKKKRHGNMIYFSFVVFFRILLYVLGAIILLMPIFSGTFLPAVFLEKISHLPALAKIGLTLYTLFAGAFLAFTNLSAAVRLIESAKLIKRHRVI